jgi:hypothetical protein
MHMLQGAFHAGYNPPGFDAIFQPVLHPSANACCNWATQAGCSLLVVLQNYLKVVLGSFATSAEQRRLACTSPEALLPKLYIVPGTLRVPAGTAGSFRFQRG